MNIRTLFVLKRLQPELEHLLRERIGIMSDGSYATDDEAEAAAINEILMSHREELQDDLQFLSLIGESKQ